MSKALLTFSNGETLELFEDQLITPIAKYTNNGDIFVSKCQTHEIWNHTHDGLIPSIAELLCKCDFFELIDNPNKIYNSSAVVSIENI